MPMMPPNFRPSGRRPDPVRRQEDDRRRGSARARGYTSKWDKAAKGHLEKNPLCVYCAMGAWGDALRSTPSTLVDHLIPHRGDQAIFWNRRDWIASCDDCHVGPKQRTERNLGALAVLANAVRAWLARRPGGGSKV